MRLTTPLNRVLGLGAAKSGVEHWWMQRLTAAALVPLGLWFAIALAGLDLSSHAALAAWIQRPIPCVLLLLTTVTAIYHSHLGIGVVIEDYVHSEGAKLTAIVVSAFAHVFAGVAAVFSILRIAFGAAV